MNIKPFLNFHGHLALWLACSVLPLSHLPSANAQTFISTGAVWRFLDNGQDPGAAWRAVNFDDSAWASGPAQLGFGDGDEATIAGAASRPVTVYFRHQFNVTQVIAGGSLMLRLLRDDGAVVYVNGVEVFRSNLPDGPVSYNTFATVAVGGPEETSVFVSAMLHPAVLVPGVNVVAVEVHQVNVTSSDLSFDLELSQDFAGTNQPTVTVVATDATAAEARTFIDEFPNPGVFRMLRSGPTNDALTVRYSLSGTASNGVDYVTLPGFVLIPAGASFADVTVSVRDDGAIEGTETVHLALAPSPCIDVIVPGCYRIGTGSVATVTILDNDTSSNTPPTAQLVAPPNGAAFAGPTNILLVANANDADGAMTVQTVEFFEGDRSLGITTNRPVLNPLGPYVLSWNDVPPGQYILRAVATDDQGARGTSAPVHVTVTSPPGNDVMLVPTGSVWKYLDTGTDQGAAWREPNFDDNSWTAGPAQLGYGDGDEATFVSFGPDPSNKYVTTYFRRALDVVSADAFESLTLRVLRDDGVVIYLNGVEVFRDNMPLGSITFDTLALAAAPDENAYLTASIPASALVNGRNVVAAEVHQVNPASSDLGFDLELVGHRGPRPPERTIINVVATDPDAAEAGLLTVVHSGTFTFYRSGNLHVPVTAFFSVGGSASNGVDYVRVTNRVSFAAGAMEARLNINPIYDTLPEGTETVVLTLEPPVCIAIVPPPPECYVVGPSNRATVYIADFSTPSNQPPVVQLNQPQDGQAFIAPANIQLQAYAQDRENNFNLRVEFFEGANSLGFGTFVPSLCPSPHCPYFALTWSNVPPGNYTLAARAIDQAGASAVSSPIHITVHSDSTSNTLIPTGAIWKYLDNGSDQGTAWREPEFDDSAWAAGPAQLGYGDGDEATVVSFGDNPANKHITTYFRRTFNVSGAANIVRLTGRLLQDDGGAVYLNGTEVFRGNLPSFGPIPFNTLAIIAAENENVEFEVPAHRLVDGANTVAVQMHQNNPASSDLSFDFSLVAERSNVVSNRPPTVSIVAPANGAVFQAPTGIAIQAVTRDADGYADTVEFFANGVKIGESQVVFIQAPPPGEPIQFEFNWANAPVGEHRLTARTRDDRGATGISSPVNITVRRSPPGDRELHVVGIYSGTVSDGGPSRHNERGDASVTVNRPGKSVTLFLSSYEPVLWHVTAGEGTVLEKVILSGAYRQELTGVGPGVETIFISPEQGTPDYIFVGYTLDSGRFFQALPRICAMTGLDISSFHGSYQAPHPAPFVIDAVQSDERLRCDYPQPTPLSELPNLSFRMTFYQGGVPGNGRLFVQNYTLRGPQNGGKLLPDMRVVPDSAQRYYYGSDGPTGLRQATRVDSQTAQAEAVVFTSIREDLGWEMGTAFDSMRQRILLVTLGGEGFLYALAANQSEWTRLASMNNLDVDCLEYHAPGDALYAVRISHADYGAPSVYEFSPEGALRREIRLPVLPFDIAPARHRSELVSVGEYLVLLLGPEYLFSSEPHESRIYLIDPRTGQVWLTYRRVGLVEPPVDSDGDGVADHRDPCPDTVADAVVNADGCSIAQLCPCDRPWRNHAEYVRCVIDRAWRFYRQGLITASARRVIVGQAARSNCGRQEGAHLHLQPETSEEVQQSGRSLIVCGETAGVCVLECSTDLLHWTPIQTITLPTTEMEVVDSEAAQVAVRFYRIRLAP